MKIRIDGQEFCGIIIDVYVSAHVLSTKNKPNQSMLRGRD